MKEDKTDQIVEEIEVASEKTGDWFEDHKSLIIGLVIAIFVIVGGYFAVKYLYVAPRERKAQKEIFYAQRYFEIDSLNLALNGDAQSAGLLEIADNYSLTKAGRLAHYYAGIIYVKQGDFEEAVRHLKKFKTSDPLMYILSHQLLGDAYLESGQTEKALATYKKGYSKHKNEVATPGIMMRAALACEYAGKDAEALKIYKEIRDNYPPAQEYQDIDRRIARLNAKLGK